MPLDVGDAITLRHIVRDRDGNPTAGTLSLTITKPSGATVTPVVSAISTGTYLNEPVTADAAGLWSFEWTVTAPVADSASGSFFVGTPGPPAYASVSDLKEYLGIGDTARDTILLRAVTSASRAIDTACGRTFWLDETATTRTDFRTRGRIYRDGADYALIVPDIAESSTLVVTGRTGVTTDQVYAYQPITRLYSASPWAEKETITARWGWPVIPDAIVQATLMLGARYYRRKDTPDGVIGSADWGAIRVSRNDPDVQALIEEYVIPGVA